MHDQRFLTKKLTARATARFPLLIMGGAVVLVVAWGLWAGGANHRHPRLDDESVNVRYIRCALGPTPRAIDADSAGLPDDTQVIGVVAGGQARAYVLSGFAEIDDHVLNDVVGGLACTVTYCPLSGCTRVFIDPRRGLPLSVAVGGFIARSGGDTNADTVMLLRIDESHYFHDTGDSIDGLDSIPYPVADYQQTTWEHWRKTHPQTDVVLGASPSM